MKNHLFIMLKVPHAGRVKTRLGRDIGMTAAAWWFRHQTNALIRRLGRDSRWHTTLAVSPDFEGKNTRIWPLDIPRWPQGQGNLGTRMAKILRNAQGERIIIIGADIPDISPLHITQAFHALGQYDATLGPAPDGGFWLIGLKKGAKPIPNTLFDHVRWSRSTTLQDTIKTLENRRIFYLPYLKDIDTKADL